MISYSDITSDISNPQLTVIVSGLAAGAEQNKVTMLVAVLLSIVLSKPISSFVLAVHVQTPYDESPNHQPS